MLNYQEITDKKTFLVLSAVFFLLIWQTVVTLQLAFSNSINFIWFTSQLRDGQHYYSILQYAPQLSFAIIYCAAALNNAAKPAFQNSKKEVMIALLIYFCSIVILMILSLISWSSKTSATILYVISWIIFAVMAYFQSQIFRTLFSFYLFISGQQLNMILGIFGAIWGISYFTALLIGSSLSLIENQVFFPSNDIIFRNIIRNSGGGYGLCLGIAVAVLVLIYFFLPNKFEIPNSTDDEGHQQLIDFQQIQQQQEHQQNQQVQQNSQFQLNEQQLIWPYYSYIEQKPEQQNSYLQLSQEQLIWPYYSYIEQQPGQQITQQPQQVQQQQYQQTNDHQVVQQQRGQISLAKLICSQNALPLVFSLVAPVYFLITLQDSLGSIYGQSNYIQKRLSERDLSYFWLLFIVPIIMISVGAVIGFLTQTRINSQIIFCLSSLALGILLMFYDTCYCFLYNYSIQQLACIAPHDNIIQYTKSQVQGQIAAKMLTGIFYGIYFTALIQEFSQLFAEQFKKDQRLVYNLTAGTFIRFLGFQNIIGNIYMLIFNNLNAEFQLRHLKSTLRLKYVFGSILILAAILHAIQQKVFQQFQENLFQRNKIAQSSQSQ